MGTPHPLVIALHGRGQSPQALASSTGFNTLADRSGFVVAYLASGTKVDWDSAGWSPPDDVSYISDEIDQLEITQNIDPARVYVVGISAGGSMAYRVGCELASKIAGVGIVSAIMGMPNCLPSRPVSVMTIVGTADGLIPINGTAHIESPAATLARWRQFDGCTSDLQQSGSGVVSTQTWASCTRGSAVVYTMIQGGRHIWPGSGGLDPSSPDAQLNASAVLWSFLAAHPSPTATTSHAAAKVDVALRSVTRRRAGGRQTVVVVLVVGEPVSVQEYLLRGSRRVVSRRVRIAHAGTVSLTVPGAPPAKPGAYVLRLVVTNNRHASRVFNRRVVLLSKLSS